jgi:hypothetical protein
MWDSGVLIDSVTWVTGAFETPEFAVDRFKNLLGIMGFHSYPMHKVIIGCI